KRNPIKAEQVTGLARVLRGNATAALENVALWHERDISHSSVERIILPDSTTLLDHMQRRMLGLIRGLVVDPERMRENIELTHGAVFSQRLLLALVGTGLQRDDAYRITQALAQRALDTRVHLRELLTRGEAASLGLPGADRVAELDLEAIFDLAPYVRFADEIVGRLSSIA
ncbi:MAG TPA: adenylosuccinate lyase, partial [Solirubrobacteraceae bacterium]|nr:adenylosuccinate lyase [Solirubrobacteraceae bacterium]